jgi:hypothetical protein
MLERGRVIKVRILRGVVGVLALAFAGSLLAASDDSGRITVLGRINPELVRLVNEVVPRAAEKLRTEKCRQILSEFRDGDRRTLEENVTAQGEDAPGYLRWLIFVNAAEEGFCVRGAQVASTNPKDRIIRLCAPFQQIARSDPGYAAALLIHEELHSLGLGENPPSSYEITRKVVEHCGR